MIMNCAQPLPPARAPPTPLIQAPRPANSGWNELNDDSERSFAAASVHQRTKAAVGQSAFKPAGTPYDLTCDLQLIQRMLRNAEYLLLVLGAVVPHLCADAPVL